jgi:hypothetical protein
METRSKDAEERRLAQKFRRRRSELQTETRELVNALEDPAGSATLARSDSKRLASQSIDPPDDIVRKVEVMTELPSQGTLRKEQYNLHETKPEGGRRQKTRIRINSGVRQRKMPLAVQQYCFAHAVHQEPCGQAIQPDSFPPKDSITIR